MIIAIRLVCRRLSVLFALTLLFISLSACSPQQEPLLRVGTNQWPGYEPLYLARELAFFDKKNIRLIEQTSSTESQRAFRYGQIDVAALTLDEVLILAETETDLRVILVLDISNGADKVMADASIQQLSDLKGKGIAVENTAVGAYMLHNLLEAAQLTISDISVHPSTNDQVMQHVDDGVCSAIVTFEPMATKLANLGFIDLFNSRQIPGKIVDVLVTRQSVIEQQKENLMALVAAQWQVQTYIQQHSDEAYQRMSPRLGITAKELAESYRGIILPDKVQNQKLLGDHSGAGLNDTIDEMSTVLLEAKILNNQPHIKQLITDQFVRQ
jgi:NitT/TauT family transport system substrate-binding protein